MAVAETSNPGGCKAYKILHGCDFVQRSLALWKRQFDVCRNLKKYRLWGEIRALSSENPEDHGYPTWPLDVRGVRSKLSWTLKGQ